MKILFLSETFPDATHPTTGTYNLALCRALAQNNQVRVISPRSWIDVLRGQRFEAGDNVSSTGIPVVYPIRWYTPSFAQRYYGGQMWWSMRFALNTLCRGWTPDAVLSYWAHPDGECGLRAGRLFDAPSAVIVGGSDVLLLPNDPVRGKCVRRVLHESDQVITVSEGLRNTCLKLGTPADHVHTIRQGIDPLVFHTGDQAAARARLGITIGSQESLAVWVGRLVGLKRVDLLIQACRQLQAQGRRLRVCLLGEGPSRNEWQQLAQSLGVAELIQFVGPIGHDRLADWYRAADVTVLCSESEGLPNVLRETVACGTPFVSTDIGSIREIAEPQYSVLVPSQNAEALARGIETVLTGNHREGAQRFVPRTWKQTADDIQSLFEQSIATRKALDVRSPSLEKSPLCP